MCGRCPPSTQDVLYIRADFVDRQCAKTTGGHYALLPQALRGSQQRLLGARVIVERAMQQRLGGGVVFQSVEEERFVIVEAGIDRLETHFQPIAVETGGGARQEALQG